MEEQAGRGDVIRVERMGGEERGEARRGERMNQGRLNDTP
jgi:hypothetical protein